jgi:3'(2'), 5'-bisphosphate nucleotidase
VTASIAETLVEIAARASKLVLEVYETRFDVDYKGPSDPVTEADRRANELICSELERAFPGIPIVAEESDEASFAAFRDSERIFFVDPVDGTREFVDRNGEFVVMIGLVEGDRPSVGVMRAPAQNVTWVGVVGEGAYQIDPDGKRSPVRVSEKAELAGARIVSSRSHRSARLEKTLGGLGAAKIAVLGSAGLKGAEVARGLAEAYVAPDYAGKRWDSCASEALVVAAGGRFTAADGKPIDYRAANLSLSTGVIASNGRVHDEIVTRLRGA